MNTRTLLKRGSGAVTSFVVWLTAVVTPHLAVSQITNGLAHTIPVIKLDDVPLTDAIRNLARQLDINYIIDPRVPGSKNGPGKSMREPLVTGRWENVSAERVLADMLKSNRLIMVTSPATSTRRITPAGLDIKPVPASQLGAHTNAVIADIVIFGQPLDEAIRTIVEKGLHLSAIFDHELFVEPEVDMKGGITFSYHDLTATQILAALLDNYDLQMMEDAGRSSALITFKSNRHGHVTPNAGREEGGYDANAKLSTTAETIKGLYTYADLQSGRYWAGHTIRLGDRGFRYDIFTDAGNDPRLKDYPQHGTFTLDGCLLDLTFPDGKVSHHILTRQRGRFVMWSPKEYDEYLRTGLVSDSVLFQQPGP